MRLGGELTKFYELEFFSALYSIMNFQKNILLKNHTTFKIGGPAKYFYIAKNKKNLILAAQWAKKKKLPFFILGGGSNVLISDRGFKGLVIKFQNQKLSEFVNRGLEWAVGIPGTVGGAIWGNAGAFQKSMKDVVKEVEVYDAKKEKIMRLNNRQCKFGRKTSIFRKNTNLIILSAKIKPRKSNPRKIKEYLRYRKEHQPLNCPSTGSIFKNPPGFFAGKLIEECGLKGKKVGGAQISEKHANFIINLGGATAKDVLKLINLAKNKVKNKFRVKLEEEIKKIS
jgi:UDP-N-acetylmuramate dehydrogenase